MVYNDDRDYDEQGNLSEEAQEQILKEELEGKHPFDWNEARKVKPVDTTVAMSAVIKAYSWKTFFNRLDDFIMKVYRARCKVLRIVRQSTLIKHSAIVYYDTSNVVPPYPQQDRRPPMTKGLFEELK